MSGKFFNAFGIFLCYGLLKDTSLLQALFFFKAMLVLISLYFFAISIAPLFATVSSFSGNKTRLSSAQL